MKKTVELIAHPSIVISLTRSEAALLLDCLPDQNSKTMLWRFRNAVQEGLEESKRLVNKK